MWNGNGAKLIIGIFSENLGEIQRLLQNRLDLRWFK